MSKTTDRAIELAQEQMESKPCKKSCNPMVELYKSIASFQQECPSVFKGTKGYGYSYADLPAIFKTINPLMAKHNLGFMQPIEGTDIKTIIFSTKTGASIESVSTIPQDVMLKGMNPFQVAGSANSYFRRYSLCSILGIISDEDNDASGEHVKPSIPEDRFQKALTAIKSGNKNAEVQLRKNFTLTNEQLKQL